MKIFIGICIFLVLIEMFFIGNILIKKQKDIKIKSEKIEEVSKTEEVEDSTFEENYEQKNTKQKESNTPIKENYTFDKNTQFVMISFDGSRSLSTWQETLDFASEMKSKDVPISFTYFISGVYFLPKHQKHLYDLSWEYPGSSDISFGDSQHITDKRIGYLNRAFKEGHEIGTHLNGHFSGSNWSKDKWIEEFDYFTNIIFNKLPTKIDRSVEPIFTIEDIKGIRSPLLSKNNNLYETLKEKKFLYDTSKVAKIGTYPWKDENGIWIFPLVHLTIDGKPSLSMDYNHYEIQTAVKDTLIKGTDEWNKAKKDVLESYLDYFDKEYNGKRAPVNIGHHFSMWNDGVYWEVLKDFAKEVCSKKDVVCTNYSKLVSFMENR
jgi:hypothetical protein